MVSDHEPQEPIEPEQPEFECGIEEEDIEEDEIDDEDLEPLVNDDDI